MKRFERFLGVFLFIMLCLGIYTIAEEITLTTYYPAPYGAYKELTTTEKTCLATSSGNVGIGTTDPKEKLDMSDGNMGNVNTIKSKLNSQPLRLQAMGSLLMSADANNDDATSRINFYIDGEADANMKMTINASGNVGIGTINPTAMLHVNGNIKVETLNPTFSEADQQKMYYDTTTKELGYDIAELFDASEEVEVGDVLVIDITKDFKLRKSQSPYEKGVIGIVSGSPAILFEGSQLEIAPTPGGFTKGTKPPVALAGRIPCKVSIENGPIEAGDFLTSSSIAGHAMRATDREKSFGTIIGKALEPFNGGANSEKTGKIIVLVTLQ